jgi:hypothetical protein
MVHGRCLERGIKYRGKWVWCSCFDSESRHAHQELRGQSDLREMNIRQGHGGCIPIAVVTELPRKCRRRKAIRATPPLAVPHFCWLACPQSGLQLLREEKT